ncbi:MAG: AAA family ATPase [Rickettsiales bacterium]
MFNHSLIAGKFAPLHKGHQLVIDTAIRESKKVTILVYSNPDFKNMPQAKRAAWIRDLYPQLNVITPSNPPCNSADDFTQREFVKNVIEQNALQIDAVFTSEDYGDGFAEHLGVKHRLVDKERAHTTISGTKIRKDIHTNRHYLDPLVYKDFVKKIVLMGAESTGKSTLAIELAKHFNTNHVPEYGREYYEEKNGKLSLEDYVHIAKEHRAIEDKLAQSANGILFVDTNAITTLFFSYYYNGAALPELYTLADQCKERYDHYFVCADDIPFEQDGWRDNEILRSKMQRMILLDLNNRKIPFQLVLGSLIKRIEAVAKALGVGR